MQKQWWEYLIDAAITFVATGFGVYLAFIVDNLRDKNAKQDLKKRLIRGLSTEVDRLEKFLIDNLNLAAYTEYFIETHILEDTVRDQIDYLDNAELISSLSDLRLLVKKISRNLELWAEYSYQPHQTGVWNTVGANLRGDWGNIRQEAFVGITTIKGLLEKETKG